MDVPVFLTQDCGHVVDVDGSRTPTVVIDASSSPAIADLARVHAIEGIGDIRTEAVRSDDLLLLGIRLSVPVQATFVIAFELDRHAGFLADVVQEQSLAIAHTDPARAAERCPTLAFTLESHQPVEVARFLGERGIYVRNGDHYAYELHRALGLGESGGTVRASLGHYNTRDEVDRLGDALDELAG